MTGILKVVAFIKNVAVNSAVVAATAEHMRRGESIMLQASECRERARTTLNGHMGEAVLVCFLATLLGGSGERFSQVAKVVEKVDDNFGNRILDSSWGGMFFAVVAAFSVFLGIYQIAIFIVGGAVELGMNKFFIKQAYGQKAEIRDEFSCFSNFGKALGLRIVTGVFVGLWSLLFVIPGIIAAYRYSMAFYIMAENPNIGVMEAIEQSKAMMAGHKWRLFCLDISFIGWVILSSFTMGIGYLFLTPYMRAAQAHFYLDLKTRQNM